jgi:hypothetical protein
MNISPARDGALSNDFPIISLRSKHHWLARRRQNSTDAPEHVGCSIKRGDQIAMEFNESSENKIANGVTLERPSRKTMLEEFIPRATWGSKGNEAATKIANSNNVKCISQPSRRPSVVGHRDDTSDFAGIIPHSSQHRCSTVATAENDNLWTLHRSMSR